MRRRRRRRRSCRCGSEGWDEMQYTGACNASRHSLYRQGYTTVVFPALAAHNASQIPSAQTLAAFAASHRILQSCSLSCFDCVLLFSYLLLPFPPSCVSCYQTLQIFLRLSASRLLSFALAYGISATLENGHEWKYEGLYSVLGLLSCDSGSLNLRPLR